MATIGSRSMAKVIHDYQARIENWRWNEPRPMMPEGWQKIGSGGFRTAYLGPDGVIYKVGSDGNEETYGSRFEVRKARRLARKPMPDFIKIPRTSGFTFGDRFIVAMEYVEAMTPPRRCNKDKFWWANNKRCTCKSRKETRNLNMCITQVREAVEKATGCVDMHIYNFIIATDGFVYPIDMGSPARDSY